MLLLGSGKYGFRKALATGGVKATLEKKLLQKRPYHLLGALFIRYSGSRKGSLTSYLMKIKETMMMAKLKTLKSR